MHCLTSLGSNGLIVTSIEGLGRRHQLRPLTPQLHLGLCNVYRSRISRAGCYVLQDPETQSSINLISSPACTRHSHAFAKHASRMQTDILQAHPGPAQQLQRRGDACSAGTAEQKRVQESSSDALGQPDVVRRRFLQHIGPGK